MCSQEAACTRDACKGALMFQHMVKTTYSARPKEQLILHAKDFLSQYYGSLKSEEEAKAQKSVKNGHGLPASVMARITESSNQAMNARWGEVLKEIEQTGTYNLTTSELAFGAKLAWRNAARCIGRIQWSKLHESSGSSDKGHLAQNKGREVNDDLIELGETVLTRQSCYYNRRNGWLSTLLQYDPNISIVLE
ncbi:Nitric oxide synthase, brain [Homalodisca vitripennis]|nr:Nitric oxide synthase, brain [Homalodisca vitripennis]